MKSMDGVAQKKHFDKLYKEKGNPKFIRKSEKFTIRSLCKIKNSFKIIDIGCGSGFFLENLKRERESLQMIIMEQISLMKE